MTALNTLFTSGGDAVILEGLEITINGTIFRVIEAYEDVTLSGEVYTACGLQLSLPKRNTDGAQDLKFTISNITGTVSTQLRAAIESGSQGTVTVRTYTSDDLNTEAETAYTMTLKKASWTMLQAEITCSYMNMLDTAWLRHRYTLAFAPGIRWL